jgi:hypothetical protein
LNTAAKNIKITSTPMMTILKLFVLVNFRSQ